ncbi:MAG: hypothetical protein H6716_21795 [Polyangiaceae bacterium]|nr:hypothetical protein [Polyangiaceae bacterium]
MKSPSSRDLMLLHDGELDAAAEAELLAALDADLAAQAELAGLEQLGDFLREAHKAAAEPEFTSVADSVMERLDEPPLRAAQPKASSAPSAPAQRERGWVVVVGVTLAAAAAGILWLRSSHPVEPVAPVASLTKTAVPVAPSTPGPDPKVEEEPVAIVSVDFGGSDGTIFVVGDESTPVVWLADDAVPAGDAKMGPL